MRLPSLLFVFLTLLLSCEETTLPKPKAQLRLEYPSGEMKAFGTEAFRFQYNSQAEVRRENATSYQLEYPKMKGTLFLNYKPVNDDLNILLADAQKFAYEHVVKADAILEQPFINSEARVFGMLYEVKGDAASQAQFYITDSTRHFLTGSLYFYSKPNYDSIYPAAIYLQEDIRKLMESLQWNE